MTTSIVDDPRRSRLRGSPTSDTVACAREQRRPPTARGPARRRHGPAAVVALGGLALVLSFAGCSLTPRSLDDERAAMDAAGTQFRRGPARVELPEPTDGDDWRGLLRRALIANGDVRASWFEWKASIEKVSGAAAWPNSNISLGYSYLFSKESVKSFNRSSFSAGFDSMQNLSFPGKPMAAGRAALEEARAAGERFRGAKFRVQREVLEAWLDLAMAAEEARLAGETAVLAGVGGDAADAALGAGGEQGDALGARIATARSDDAVAAAHARIASAKATLAALTATDSPDRVFTPTTLPTPRALPADPAVLLAAVNNGPEVKGFEAERRARAEEKDLAVLQWIPDINPTAAVTGSIEQSVGAILVLPTKIAEIRSGIATAKAMRSAAGARLAQARRDQRGDLQATLVAASNSERARRLLQNRVLPAAISASVAAESAYTAGRMDLAGLVESRLLVVDVRSEVAASVIEREKQVAAIEEILGADLETFTGDRPLRVAAAPQETF